MVTSHWKCCYLCTKVYFLKQAFSKIPLDKIFHKDLNSQKSLRPILVCNVCHLDLQFQWQSMAVAASGSVALHIHMEVLHLKKKKKGKKKKEKNTMGLFSSKETVVYRFCHWQAHQRARKSQNEQGKTHILQQWRDQKRLLLPAAVPGISLDSWSPQLEIPASFATAYKISCWEMPVFFPTAKTAFLSLISRKEMGDDHRHC